MCFVSITCTCLARSYLRFLYEYTRKKTRKWYIRRLQYVVRRARGRCIYNPYVCVHPHTVTEYTGARLDYIYNLHRWEYILTELDDVRVNRSARARTRTRMYVRAGCRRILVYWSRVVDRPLLTPSPLPRRALFAPSRPASYPYRAPAPPDSTLGAPVAPGVLVFPPRDVTHPEKLGLAVIAGHTYSHVCRLSRRYMRHVTSVYFSSVSYAELVAPRYLDWISSARTSTRTDALISYSTWVRDAKIILTCINLGHKSFIILYPMLSWRRFSYRVQVLRVRKNVSVMFGYVYNFCK